MKPILCFLLMCLLHNAFATNYYFSTISGDDNRTPAQAQNPGTPWKTIAKLNSFFSSLQPGDVVLFNRGETFYGSIALTKSGTASFPIVFSAYGSGNKPIITGLTTLTNWTSVGNGIWESYAPALGSSVNTVLLNNSAQQIGRYPNSDAPNKGYLTYEAHSNLSITDYQLSSSPNWTGADVVIRKLYWIIDRNLIQSHIGNTLTFMSGSGYTPWQNNSGYFIQNDIRTLDQLGEWYYNPSTKKMYVYFGSNSPSNYTIEASALDYLVTNCCSAGNMVFDNLTFKGSNLNTINLDYNNNISIKYCDILFSGVDAIKCVNSSNFKLENSYIANSNNNGVSLEYENSNAVIRNNKIENTHIIAGMGKSGDGNGIGIQVVGPGNLIEYNEIVNTGYDGIFFSGNSAIIKNNFINNFCLTKDDGGGIYTNTEPSEVSYTGRKIIGNVILNGKGTPEGLADGIAHAHGMYLDGLTTGLEVSGNTVANNSSYGIFCPNPSNTILDNNTLFNNRDQFVMNHSIVNYPVLNNVVTNNIFFSKKPTQMASTISSIGNDIGGFGTFDYNYYARPFDDKITIYNQYANTSGTISESYDLDTWKAKYNKDASSKRSPLQFPGYIINSLTGSNKFINGTFNSNVNGVSGWTAYNNMVLSYTTGVLDGGSLQVAFNAVSGTPGSSLITMNVGGLSSAKKYILKFSMKGSNDNFSLGTFIRKNGGDYSAITASQFSKIASARTENELLFSVPADQTDADLVFTVDNQNIKFWIDNVQFYEADVATTNPDDYVRFEYNPTNTNKSVTLDKNYIDVKSNNYSNTVTLAPYSSVILLQNGTLASQTINFAPLPNKTFGDLPFTISATASSGLPVSFRIVSGPALLSGNTVTLTGVGTVIIEASQSGNASFNPAPSVTQNFSVIAALLNSQTISFAPLSNKIYGDLPFTISATASSGLPVSFRVVSGAASLSGNTVTLTGVGTVIIEASQAGNATYNPAPSVTQSFSVIAAPLISQTISFAPLSNKIYGDLPFTISATASSGLPVSFRIVSGPALLSGNTVTLTGIGTVIIEASQSGNTSYNPAPSVTQSFSVIAAAQTINFAFLPNKTYGDLPFNISATASSGLPVSFRVVSGPASLSGNTIMLTGVGTVIIEASQSGNTSYNPAPSVTQSFSVIAAALNSQTINFAQLSDKTYGDLAFIVKATASSGLPVSFRVLSGPASLSLNTVTLTGVGTVIIEASQAGNATYNAAPAVTQSFSITTVVALANFPPIITPKNITVQADSTGQVIIKPTDVVQSITDDNGVDYSTLQVSQTQFLCSSINTSTTGSHQAYIATTTTGTQNFGGELGMEFKVKNAAGITINQLGAFDHQGNGISGSQSGGIRVAIFNKATQTIVPGLDAIIIGNADSYSGNHRMKNITPVTLLPGDYVVVAKGYNANELNGNSAGSLVAPGDLGGGAISYATSCMYGSEGTGFAYPTNPDGGPGNRYLAGTFSYSTVSTTTTVSHQAYIATTTTGTQNFGGELGMEFKVNNAAGITINQLGAFDHQGNGISGSQSGGIRVAIFNKATKTIVPGLDAVIIGNADSYTGNYRMKNITAVTLMPGDYVVVAKGYNANELNGNAAGGTPFASGDLAGGAITYATSCLYGSAGTGFAYPTNPDGGPGNRYLAGTFSYSTGSTASTTVSHQAYIATTTTGTQNFGGELGMEFKVNTIAGITINQLGAFDHQGNGITGTQSGGIRVAIFNKATKTIVPGLDAIIIGNADSYSGNHRMKNITAVTLMQGDYVVVAKGYNANELNGNSGGGISLSSGDWGGGAISYASTCSFGSAGTGFAYPTNPDGGPGNRYLAGTFSYSTASTASSVASNINDYIVTITVKDNSGNIGQANATVTVNCNQPLSVDPSQTLSTGFQTQSSAISQNPVKTKDALFSISTETLRVFPNPSNGQFSVALVNAKAQVVTIQILTESGIVVDKKSLSMSGETAETKVEFDLTKQPSGIYFVKVITRKEIQIRKVMVIR